MWSCLWFIRIRWSWHSFKVATIPIYHNPTKLWLIQLPSNSWALFTFLFSLSFEIHLYVKDDNSFLRSLFRFWHFPTNLIHGIWTELNSDNTRNFLKNNSWSKFKIVHSTWVYSILSLIFEQVRKYMCIRTILKEQTA